MDNFAKMEESFKQYFEHSMGWFIIFCIFGLSSVVMIITSFACVSCPTCCRNCKRDLKSSDYPK